MHVPVGAVALTIGTVAVSMDMPIVDAEFVAALMASSAASICIFTPGIPIIFVDIEVSLGMTIAETATTTGTTQ